MNVVMLISGYPPVIGGSEIQCQRLSRALAQRGHHITILTETLAGVPAESQDGNIRVVRVGRPSRVRLLQTLSYIKTALTYLMSQSQIDILHAHLIASPALVGLWHGRRAGIPVVIKAAGARKTGDIGTSKSSWQGRFKLYLLQRWAKAIVCPSDEVYEELRSLPIPEHFLHRLVNGVDTHQWKPLTAQERTQKRQDLHLPSGRILVCATRWVPGKGIEALIDFFRSMEKSSSWTLLLLLAIPQEGGSGAPVSPDNLPPSVQLIVNAPSTQAYISCANAAILLSEGEGISNFLLESMACGLPVLTTRAAALGGSETVPSWGWILDRGTAWQEALRQWLSHEGQDENSLKQKGDEARQFVHTHYRMEVVAQHYETLYDTLLKH